ncbi:hypothetical protein DICPUDRAFT_75958 [Dictyostelium purpureum]|uniref:Bulb-type lectin domain-containing protein n=1 Tax=Dictyostelium purpureum TaxID=5786 RepID=F0ZC59_DICPU|nr:uncharacterized protein DICPUDRAFT_75958 [Dictyostelium purpureum]EGC38467.1 hypothetical protein DICPUDRAFT_75958 [Dictyostelium purpureum]|eukprot:XP_003285025.1 hypothetical protein DICPUDRAFT_75958 [Dictyostelium purpureum]
MIKDTLQIDETLHSDEGVGKLVSWNDRYEAVMQTDGNWVVYSIPKSSEEKRRVIFASHSEKHGHHPYRMIMQGDGNLCLYDTKNHCTWSSNTCNKKTHKSGPYFVRLYDSGSLKVFDGSNDTLWSSPIDSALGKC